MLSKLKQEKRRFFKKKIHQHWQNQELFSQYSKQISDYLLQLKIWKKGWIVASYFPLPGELSCAEFYKKMKHNCCFVFPKIQKDSNKIKFVKACLDKKEDWQQSLYGTWQPIQDTEIPVNQINVFLVPGLAFDREGQRLGRGKGYYDRALSQSVGSLFGLKIGIAGTYQISHEALPEQNHDIKMDAVLTNDFFIIPLKKTQRFNIINSNLKKDYGVEQTQLNH